VNVRENYESAIEQNPEAFASVVMLYINCNVNGVPMKAFVDSGAQMTILSENAARHCNVMHLVDRHFAGTAYGVGERRIVGRVHMAPLGIGGEFFPCSFTVLEGDAGGISLLFGLDMLR
jgi:DNA damage-inducible protein 1